MLGLYYVTDTFVIYSITLFDCRILFIIKWPLIVIFANSSDLLKLQNIRSFLNITLFIDNISCSHKLYNMSNCYFVSVCIVCKQRNKKQKHETKVVHFFKWMFTLIVFDNFLFYYH